MLKNMLLENTKGNVCSQDSIALRNRLRQKHMAELVLVAMTAEVFILPLCSYARPLQVRTDCETAPSKSLSMKARKEPDIA